MNESDKIWDQVTVAAIQSILKNTKDIIFIKDAQLIYRGASQSFARLVGLQDSADVVGKVDAQIFEDADLVRRYTEDDRRVLTGGKALESYIEPVTIDNEVQGYCQTSKFPLFDDQGAVIGLYAIAHDITREYKAKLNYERELRALFELPPDALGAALFDVTNWRLIDMRVNGDRVRGFANFGSVDELIENFANSVVEDTKARDFYLSCSRESIQSMFENGKRRISIEYQRKLSEGTIRWVCNDLYFLFDPLNGNLCVMSIVRDIDKEKKAVYTLTRAAERDSLTDVYNRDTTMARIQRFLENEGADGAHLLFMIDVDNFKLLNDTLGHQNGDEALARIAAAIRKVFRASDIVGRIGGDEFFALMKDACDPGLAQKKATELVEVLQYECSNGDERVEISGSVGISYYQGKEKTLAQLYAEADSALHKAKKMGKNCFVFAESSAGSWAEKSPLNTVSLRMLLENVDASMFQTELDGEGDVLVTYSSHSLFTDAEQNLIQSGARGENIWQVILPEDLTVLKSAIRTATVNRTVLDCSCRVKNSVGQIEWRHVCGTQMPDQGDGIRRMIHVVTDITRQKQTEAELREKNSIIDFAMRNTDVNLWYFDYETATCQLTKSCQKAHEMPGVEELKNFPECLFEIGYVREDSIERHRLAYEQLRKTGESVEFDVWFRKADGTGWWCERNMLSPLIGADGRVTRGIGIGKNVTTERILEQKYETFGAYRRLAEKNTRVSFRLNLTTGWFGDCVSSIQAVRNLYPVDTADAFFQLLRERIIAKKDMVDFDGMLSTGKLLEAFACGESLRSLECRFRIEDGRVIWLRITVEMMRNPVTGDVEALFYSFDIDHEKNMKFLVDKLLDNDYEFLGLIDTDTGRLMVFGENANVPGMAQNGGIYEEEQRRVFRGLILDEYYDEGIRNMALAHVMGKLNAKEYYTCSFPARDYAHTRAGRKQWKFAYLDDSKSKILMVRTDITSLYTAEYDSLTGLYNRKTFYQRTREMLDAHPSEEFLLLRFDIDRFKAYNEVYGIQAGDRLLAAAGRAARERVWPEPAVFGRLEADHFVSVMPIGNFDVEAWSIGHIAWLKSVTEGYRLTSSVGVYRITDPTLEISLMCDRALLALNTVKDNYTQKVAWYNDSLREKLMHDQALADEMEHALSTGQFVVFFQPLIDYEHGSLIGAEALVRWCHPERGLIPPGEFIPLFEKNGFILKLDAFVWEKSCEYLRHWMDTGKTLVPVSVNVSRCNLYDPELCKRFQTLLNKYRLPFSLLKLEITESAYMDDPDQLMGIVDELRSTGFIVEMDDFGTGYSSLNMLKDMPVDILKLDTRFISESEDDARAATILSSIIQMAHQLGLSVIAEGVETKAQAESLKSLNCSKMQGYYFGRPVPVKEFENMLHIEGKVTFP